MGLYYIYSYIIFTFTFIVNPGKWRKSQKYIVEMKIIVSEKFAEIQRDQIMLGNKMV